MDGAGQLDLSHMLSGGELALANGNNHSQDVLSLITRRQKLVTATPEMPPPVTKSSTSRMNSSRLVPHLPVLN